MRSVPKVGILIVRRTFDQLHWPPGGDFDQLFCLRGGEFECYSLIKMSTPHPMPDLLFLGPDIDRCITFG